MDLDQNSNLSLRRSHFALWTMGFGGAEVTALTLAWSVMVFCGHMSILRVTGTPVLDFWWCLLWVSKPEWVLPYSLFCEGKCNVHSPKITVADPWEEGGARGPCPPPCLVKIGQKKKMAADRCGLYFIFLGPLYPKFLDPLLDPLLVLHMPTSWQTASQPVTSKHSCAEVGLCSDSNVQSPGQKTNALPLSQRPWIAS